MIAVRGNPASRDEGGGRVKGLRLKSYFTPGKKNTTPVSGASRCDLLASLQLLDSPADTIEALAHCLGDLFGCDTVSRNNQSMNGVPVARLDGGAGIGFDALCVALVPGFTNVE